MMARKTLTHPSPELLPCANGLNLLKVHLLNLFTSSIEISLDGLDERLTEPNLVSTVKSCKQEQRDVSNEEIASVPRHKGSETLSQDDEDVEENTIP